MFSSYVSMTLSLTVWGSLWTYIVLAFWWLVALFVTWVIPYALFGGGLLAILGTLTGVVAVLEWFEDRKRR
jgi:hypothetical protein